MPTKAKPQHEHTFKEEMYKPRYRKAISPSAQSPQFTPSVPILTQHKPQHRPPISPTQSRRHSPHHHQCQCKDHSNRRAKANQQFHHRVLVGKVPDNLGFKGVVWMERCCRRCRGCFGDRHFYPPVLGWTRIVLVGSDREETRTNGPGANERARNAP